MLSVIFYCYAECRYAECHYDECRYAEYRYAECQIFYCYAECRSAECLHGWLATIVVVTHENSQHCSIV